MKKRILIGIILAMVVFVAWISHDATKTPAVQKGIPALHALKMVPLATLATTKPTSAMQQEIQDKSEAALSEISEGGSLFWLILTVSSLASAAMWATWKALNFLTNGAIIFIGGIVVVVRSLLIELWLAFGFIRKAAPSLTSRLVR